ncbi:chalcone isomerase family protein [Ectothiorhodosinus mongolicus]|nr:chalcone isomerase family protein [Ectothiorhodosinus mongolicus]
MIPSNQDLVLKSSGTATWMRFVRVYDAALFAPSDARVEQVLQKDVPLSLKIEYLIGVSADNIVKAADVALARQHGPEVLDRYSTHIQRLHQSYQSTEPGDRYRLDYRPGEGISLWFNDQYLVSINDDKFARLYVGIWLGEQPLSERLRTALLNWED